MMNGSHLDPEFEWINNHPEYYDSKLHMESVKGNIQKRKQIQCLEKQIDELEKEIKK